MKSRLFKGLRVLRALLGKALVLVGTLTTSLVIAPSVHGEQVIDTVTVVGTRTERKLEEVAATITVKDREDIEREMVRDMADLIRFEPGVTVAGTGSRFGLTSFNIRGIGGNRVLTMIDGVRVPDEFSFGPFLSARRDFVDVDSLDQVEIARGPISTLYGSDALGGVVAMRTLGPEDFLGDRSIHLGAKLGYSSADSSLVSRLSVAGDFNDAASGLLHSHIEKGTKPKIWGQRIPLGLIVRHRTLRISITIISSLSCVTSFRIIKYSRPPHLAMTTPPKPTFFRTTVFPPVEQLR